MQVLQQRLCRLAALIARARLLIFLVLWLPPCAAFAESTSDQMAAIQQRMEEGLTLFVADKPIEAAQVFEQGYAAYPYSAFLFNAGICYEKVGKNAQALAKYREYMAVDPNSPDIAEVRERVAKLEAAVNQVDVPAPATDVGKDVMRSLVVVETEPSGAPVRVYRPSGPNVAPFEREGENPGWTEVVATTAPTSLSLGVGRYQIVVDEFEEFNASDTELNVLPGHVHHFRANLSQGVFMAFLRVSGNVKGAHVYLDDPTKSKPEWGTTPYGELVPAGEHRLLVEAPGFQPVQTKVALESGERKEVEVNMARVDYGFVRVDADVSDITVSVDGKVEGRWRQGQPPLDIRAQAGTHTLTVTAEDRKDFEGQITVPKGQVLPVRAKMIPKYPRGAAWTQAVLAGASLGAGIYLGLESERLKDDLRVDQQRGVLQADDSRISKGFWFAVGADVGFGAAAVLGALSTWNFIKDPLPESSIEQAPPVEFEDPLKAPPPAKPQAASTPAPSAQRPAPKAPPRPAVEWQLRPTVGPDVAGFAIGGAF